MGKVCRMRLFVTGGAGFLGRHFIKAATDSGCAVNALTRKTPNGKKLVMDNLHWIVGSLEDDHAKALQNCDMLVHLAAAGVSPQKADWNTLYQTNVLDSMKLILSAVNAGIRRFVICGSCFEYGRSGERYDRIPPNAPLEPTNGYGASKASATIMASAIAVEYDLQLLIVRPFTLYGEGQYHGNFWPMLKKAALAGYDFEMTAGEQLRDFCSVDEVSKQIVNKIHHFEPNPGIPKVVNLGSGLQQSLADFARHWWSHWGARGELKIGAIPYRNDEVMRFVPEL